MRKHLALGAALALGFGTHAFAAEGFSYSNAEIGYASTEISGVDGDGLTLGLSVGFAKNFFGFAGYNDFSYDGGFSSNQLTAGVGFHWPLNDKIDLVTGLSYEDFEVKASGIGSASDDGFGLGAGLRGRLSEKFELSGGGKYIDLGGGSDDIIWMAAAHYYFTPKFALGADISDGDSGTTFGIKLRYDFGAGR